jgi:hypothetical protein
VIQHALDNPGIEETSDSDTEWVELNHLSTKFWYTGNPYDENDPDFTLPTQHFKVIVEGWRDFLLTPPKDGLRSTSAFIYRLIAKAKYR